jgi:hypothetical protein
LQLAQVEFHAASVACQQSSERCTRLDMEQKYWLNRREQAQTDFGAALKRYSAAQDALAKLQSGVVASGSAQPISTAGNAIIS